MKIKSNKLLILIFLLALILRIIKLTEFPTGFHVDEVKVGWNAYSISKTLKDDKLNMLPFYYNTFGDYRPTGIFYISIPSILLFGQNVFATRFTSAFIGALSVIALYLLVKIIFNEKIALWSSLILAISPWHIQTSRATSEVVISSFFVILSIYFYIAYTKSDNKKYLLLNIISVSLSYFLYHSARLLVPIYLLLALIHVPKKKFFPIIFSIILTAALLLGKGTSQRFLQVSIFKNTDIVYELERSNEPKFIVYSRNLIEEYGKYFSSDFLIGESAKPYRYLTVGVGLLNYIDIILLIYGVYLIIKDNKNKFSLFALLVSPFAAILTIDDSPNLHRSLYMIIFISIIEGYAIYNIKYKKIITEILFLGLIYFIYSYFLMSDLHIPYQKNLYIESPVYRNYGNIELVEILEKESKNYDQIYISNYPDNLYPWYAFVTKKDPKIFNIASYIPGSNSRKFENIIFTDVRCPSDTEFEANKESKILVVDYLDCNSEIKIKDGMKAKIVGQIKRPDNTIVYYLLTNK